jgi:peptidoglycan/LPS O-acetylase OafA/YrhL
MALKPSLSPIDPAAAMFTGEITGPQVHPVRTHIGALTGLRFCAAMYVFVFHFGTGFAERSGAPLQLVTFLSCGYLGVSIFFVLSGFILTYTYRQRVDSPQTYAVARFARIYPVYLFALLLALPLALRHLTTLDALRVLGMVQSWTPINSTGGYAWIMQAWTLSVEIVFYICFPGLTRLLRLLPRNGILLGIAVTASMIVAGGTSSIAPGVLRPDLPYWIQFIPIPLLRMPEFMLGMLICTMFNRRSNAQGSGLQRVWNVFVPVFLGLIIVILSENKGQPQVMGLVTVFFAALIYLIASTRTIVTRILASKTLQLLGGASYSMYLLQGPIREWVGLFVPSAVLAQALNPVVLIATAIAVFVWIERPSREIILSVMTRGKA